MNYSCNIIVPSLVLLLCQLFTFAHNMRYCFTFLVTHSTKWWLCCFINIVFHIVCSNCLFLCSTKYGFCFNFQVSFSQPVSCFLFLCCFWHFSQKLSLYPFVFFIVPSFPSSACLNSFLFTVSLYYVVSAAFTPSVNGSTEFLTYNPKLFSFIFINHSQLINPLPLVSLIRCTLWISLLGCSAPCIVINFLVPLPKFFNSTAFHFRIPVPYLIIETA